MKIKNRLSIGIFSAIVLVAASPSARAQTNTPTGYKFDFGSGAPESGWTQITPATMYSSETGYGFEVGTLPVAVGDDALGANEPFYFSVKEPEGNYKITVTFGSAGIFRLHVGQSSQAVAMNQDWTLNGPTNPATRGSIVTVWATGYGETSPACTVGGLNDPLAEPLNAGMSALIFSGATTTAQYAGSAPALVCGIVQINFQVPQNIAPGTWGCDPWVRLVNGAASDTFEPPIGATIFVK